ncbi:MAG TPA: DUF3473 domain-containing protein [Candidatus Kapabacteria bacterium]|nr:DUF3473 domain-containing protein [Candidatus Kapabacteria bacterium]
MADRRYTINAFTVKLEAPPEEASTGLIHSSSTAGIERSVDELLAFLESNDVHATFFISGEVAQSLPQLVARVRTAGHEIGMLSRRFHTPLDQLLRFREEVAATKERLEDLCGQEVIGYRSTPISSGWRSPAMLETLVQEGFLYSSSTYPKQSIAPALINAQVKAYRMVTESGTLWELPLTTWRPFGIGIPQVRTGGGTRLSALPAWVFARGVEGMNRHGEPAILYVHSWALDSNIHDYSSLPFRERLLTYGPRKETLEKLGAIFRMFRFGSIQEAFASRLTTESKRPTSSRRTSIVRADTE